MNSIFRFIFTLSILDILQNSAPAEVSEQENAVRSINQLFADGKFDQVHAQWAHPHLQNQVNAEEFADSMKGNFGKGVIQLFNSVVKLLDAKAGEDKLLAKAQDDENEFSFVLVEVKALPERGNQKWHLELGLHDGKWKLLDVD